MPEENTHTAVETVLTEMFGALTDLRLHTYRGRPADHAGYQNAARGVVAAAQTLALFVTPDDHADAPDPRCGVCTGQHDHVPGTAHPLRPGAPAPVVAMHEVTTALMTSAHRAGVHPARLLGGVAAAAIVAGTLERDDFVANLDAIIGGLRRM